MLSDFNIYPRIIVFLNLLNDLNLTQHIHELTHSKCNTLDIVIIKNNSKTTDHNIIHIYLKYIKSSAKKETITYRNLKNINNTYYTNDLYKLIILNYTNTHKIHQHLKYMRQLKLLKLYTI